MIAQYLKRGGLAALVLAAIAFVAAAFWAAENATARGLAGHGVTTQAYVVQKQQNTGVPSGEAAYEVTYLYQSEAADGSRRTHRIEHEVPASVYNDVTVGRQVEVRYLPEDPAVAAVYPGEHADGRSFLNILALVAAAAAAATAVTGLGLARRAGRPAPAAA